MKIIQLIRHHPFAKIIFFSAAIIGMIFVILGMIEISKTSSYITTCLRADGTVTGNDYQAFPDKGASYCPIVKFRAAGGNEIQFTDPVGTFPEEYHAGDKVAVFYSTADPTNARIDSWGRLWLGQTIITGIGVLVIAVGIAVTVLVARMG